MNRCPLYEDGKCAISDADCVTGDFDKEKCTGYYPPEYVVDIKDNKIELKPYNNKNWR